MSGIDLKDGKLPLVVLTGFLGAGKTTRLNDWLRHAEASGVKVAVVENEIGSVPVDDALVANTHDGATLTVTSSCVCCSGAVDLIAALEALAAFAASTPIVAVVVETTGMADIGPVVALLRDPQDPLAESFRPCTVVCVVDVANATALDDSIPAQTWARQVAFADRVVLAKADLAAAERTDEITATVSALNPLALQARALALADAVTAPPVPALPLPPSARTGSSHDLHGVSVAVVGDRVYDPERLRAVLQKWTDVWRVKGIVRTATGALMLVQGVADTVTLEPIEGASGPTGLVAIGQFPLAQRTADLVAAEACSGPGL